MIIMQLLQLAVAAATTWRNDATLLDLLIAEGLGGGGTCGFPTVASANTTLRKLRRRSSSSSGGRLPVLITGAAAAWPALQTWRNPHEFRLLPGTLLPRWPTGVRTFGVPVRSSPASLKQFINGMQDDDPSAGMLLDYVRLGTFGAGTAWWSPAALTDEVANNDAAEAAGHSMLSVGATRQGYPFHNHAAAWETVVVGYKLVLSFPPSLALSREVMDALTLAPPRQLLPAARGGATPALRALLEIAASNLTNRTETRLSSVLEALGISHCLLAAGDTAYFPCGVYHATLNVGDTVAVGAMHTLHSRAGAGAEECPPAAEDVHGASTAAEAAALATVFERRARATGRAKASQLLAAALKAKRVACKLAPFAVLCPLHLGRLLRLESTLSMNPAVEDVATRETARLLEASGARLADVERRGFLPAALLSVALGRYADELVNLATQLAHRSPALAAELQGRARRFLAASVNADGAQKVNTKAQVSWAMAQYGESSQSAAATREALRKMHAARRALLRTEVEGETRWYHMLDNSPHGGSRADAAHALRLQIDQSVDILTQRLPLGPGGAASRVNNREL